MNRFTVILFTLAILLAHALAIHQAPTGDFGPPYDVAHVAYRLGRHLVRTGSAAWNPGGEVFESHPSPLLILVAAAAERVYLPPTVVAQVVGTAATLLTVVVLAQFGASRASGLIAPGLLAVSGAVAAVGGSGTEAGLAMLAATTAVLAFERGWGAVLGTSLALCLLARPEGTVLLLLLGLLEVFDRPRDALGRRRAPLRKAWIAPVATWAALVLVRRWTTGSWLSPFEAAVLGTSDEAFGVGLRYLEGFVLCSGSGFLVVLPLTSLLFGRLSGVGRRALAAALAWSLLVALSGGDGLPFWSSLAPVLPLVFLSVQESITGWLDRRPATAPLFHALLAVAVGASLLVSRLPTDIGPLRIEAWHRAWMQPHETLGNAFGRRHGRLGLQREIEEVESLRALGIFFRDRVKDPATIATIWPGAIGYLSRKEVRDMLGRTTPLAGRELPRSWSGQPQVDLVELFAEEGSDYFVPVLGQLRHQSVSMDLLHEWLQRHDVVGDTEERMLELLTALVHYELVTVPVPPDSETPLAFAPTPFLILRAKALGEAPRLQIAREGRSFDVLVRHHSNQQIADLSVILEDEDGRVWRMRPTGEFVRRPGVTARTNVLLHPTGSRPIRALHGTLPESVGGGRLTAQLHNPGTSSELSLTAVGAPASVEVGG